MSSLSKHTLSGNSLTNKIPYTLSITENEVLFIMIFIKSRYYTKFSNYKYRVETKICLICHLAHDI